jgi:hypothetical protein
MMSLPELRGLSRLDEIGIAQDLPDAPQANGISRRGKAAA